MNSFAWYKIIIPVNDNYGNKLADLATAVHQWLHISSKGKVQGSHTTRGVTGHWRDDPNEPMDILETLLPDTPENDSLIKNAAVHVGEIANQWGVACMKTGKGGPSSPWIMNNRHYDPSKGADPDIIVQYANEATKPSVTSSELFALIDSHRLLA